MDHFAGNSLVNGNFFVVHTNPKRNASNLSKLEVKKIKKVGCLGENFDITKSVF
jgi:hypothetical protein